MNAIDAYLMELEQEAATTRRLIENVPESRYSWKPNDKGMSIGGVIGHLAGLLMGMPMVLGGESFDISQRPGPETLPFRPGLGRQ